MFGEMDVMVNLGDYLTMTLTSSGFVFTWVCGDNRSDYCFGESPEGKGFSVPHLVKQLCEHNVVQIATGHQHCVALVDPSPSPIRQSQQASFNNKQHSDVVFMVENEPLYANVDLLSRRIDYYAAMF